MPKKKTPKKKAKRKAAKKTTAKKKAKAKSKKPRSKQPGKRNNYARIPKDILAEMDRAPRHTNGLDITDRQSMFVEHLLCAAKWNATKAAKLAGYSEKTAYTQGPAQLRNPSVCKYLRKRIDDRRRRLEVKQDKLIEAMAAIALFKPSEFVDVKNGTIIVKDLADIPLGIQGAVRSYEPVFSKWGQGIKVRFSDPIAATKLLMQHLGMLEIKARGGSKGTIVEFMERIHSQAKAVGEEAPDAETQ